jgi:uracil-DNA glycosylase
VAACRPFLQRELEMLDGIRVVLALGKIAFDGYLQLLKSRGIETAGRAFGHGATHLFAPPLPTLMASYHPSRQNTQTGRLTSEMLAAVLAQVRRLMESDPLGG